MVENSYIKFDRRAMANLDESLQREYIRTNRKGAYYCSTVVDCNTRKYHGALVVPIPELSPNNHVLLSSLDLSIVQYGVSFNLGLHQYPNNYFNPNGQKYIRQYNLDRSSLVFYRVGGLVLSREMLLCRFEHRLIVKYTLVEASSSTTLRFSPFLAFRDVKLLTHKNEHINKEKELVEHGYAFQLYDNYPKLYLQLSKANNFVDHAHWNEQLCYEKERERAYEYTEDLYVPGYFETTIKQGESIYFSAGLEEVGVEHLQELFEQERASRIRRDTFRNCLLNAAQQFYYRPNDEDAYILAGYPWFGIRARDLFIALPGCSFYADAPERYERILRTMKPIFNALIEGKSYNKEIQKLDDPDVGLWFVWAIQQYHNYQRNRGEKPNTDTAFIKKIIHYYLNNQNPYVRFHENALLRVQDTVEPHTWMDAQLNGASVIKRTGFLVEINALWYNALMFYKEVSDKEEWTEEYEFLSKQICKSFNDTFVNKHHYLFDTVREHGQADWGVRPNMIFAVSLPFSPLPINIQKTVLEYVTRELRTSKGLRTLSPNSLGYWGVCNGKQEDREQAYYNGSIWPWLLGAYFEAYIKLYGKLSISFIERTLIGMEVEMQEHGLGTISELFDGNPPHKGRGAISFAMSVGEILRSLALLEELKDKNKVK